MIKGHVTICKVYKDGTKETVLDRANMITAGLGSSFIDIQQGIGSTSSIDYVPGYFQIGNGTAVIHDIPTSSFIYQVCAPLDWEDYGVDTDLLIEKRYRGFYASSTTDGIYEELLESSATLANVTFSGVDQYFGHITTGSVTKYFMNAFEAQIVLDENTANGISITELGLFSRNPKGFYSVNNIDDSPLLMAYRNFAALNKTAEFSLVVNWTIGFLGLTPNIDDYYTGDVMDPSYNR